MTTRYVHTNLVAGDWRRLASFYVEVFGCVSVPPERHLRGEWLDRATSLEGARIDGVHLRLPGHGEHGPTLEVFQYSTGESGSGAQADRKGFGHIAFSVCDVHAMAERIVRHGGCLLGEIVTRDTWSGHADVRVCRRPGGEHSRDTELGEARPSEPRGVRPTERALKLDIKRCTPDDLDEVLSVELRSHGLSRHDSGGQMALSLHAPRRGCQ